MNGIQTFLFGVGILALPLILMLWFNVGNSCDHLARVLRAHAAAKAGYKAIYKAIKNMEKADRYTTGFEYRVGPVDSYKTNPQTQVQSNIQSVQQSNKSKLKGKRVELVQELVNGKSYQP